MHPPEKATELTDNNKKAKCFSWSTFTLDKTVRSNNQFIKQKKKIYCN
jgi:hypothetical protein